MSDNIKEQLIERLNKSGLGFKPVKVLSIEEAEEYALLHKTVNIISFRGWNEPISYKENEKYIQDLVLLTNDCCFGTFIHNKNWVHSSHSIPMNVVPNGKIKNVTELLDLFYPKPNRVLITSTKKFADWLITTNSYYDIEKEAKEKLKYGIVK